MSAVLAPASARIAMGRAKDAVDRPYGELFDGVDDLIHRVAHTESPDIRKSRAKVYTAMVAAKSAVELGANQTRADQLRADLTPIGDMTEDFFLDYSGKRLGVALLVGLGLGLLSA
jgi:ElaB/YqjD/DUF883 family membrane-anchored ribosome-binding protein